MDKPFRKHKRIKLSKEFRISIFERDNYECQRCFKNLIALKTERVIDHKIPLSKGGSNHLNNLWLLCKGCDTRKKDKLEDDLTLSYIKNRLKFLQKRMPNGNKNNDKK